MKKFIKLLAAIYLGCLLKPGVNAQSYVLIPDSNAIWSEYYYIYEGIIPDTYPYYMILTGDTAFNNFTYHKIVKSNDTIIDFSEDNYTGCFREDENKTVWFLPADSVYEVLLYDFSKVVGDTIMIPTTTLWKYDTLFLIIEKIDSVEIEGNYRKIFKFINSGFKDHYWIEGIGSTEGFLHSFYLEGIDEGHELNCLTYNGDFIYQNPESWLTDCFVFTDIEDEMSFHNRIIISPNPSNGIFYLNNDFDHTKTILIYSIFGNFIIEKPLNKNSYTIDLSGFNPGIYMLIIENTISGQCIYTKLILTK